MSISRTRWKSEVMKVWGDESLRWWMSEVMNVWFCNYGWWMSEFSQGVMNVSGDECRGDICWTIIKAMGSVKKIDSNSSSRSDVESHSNETSDHAPDQMQDFVKDIGSHDATLHDPPFVWQQNDQSCTYLKVGRYGADSNIFAFLMYEYAVPIFCSICLWLYLKVAIHVCCRFWCAATFFNKWENRTLSQILNSILIISFPCHRR